jgi:hypothetical protein
MPDNSDENTVAHIEYLVFIVFPRQQLLSERSLVCYMYVAGIVRFLFPL